MNYLFFLRAKSSVPLWICPQGFNCTRMQGEVKVHHQSSVISEISTRHSATQTGGNEISLMPVAGCLLDIPACAQASVRLSGWSQLDDIDGLAGEEKELTSLVERLDTTSRAYGMEIHAEKTKLMTNNNNGICSDIKVNGQTLDTVSSFKYPGAIVSDEGSKQAVLPRIAQATAALAKLKPIWKDKNISLASKARLQRSLVISISFMLVKLGHLRQRCRGEYRAWR